MTEKVWRVIPHENDVALSCKLGDLLAISDSKFKGTLEEVKKAAEIDAIKDAEQDKEVQEAIKKSASLHANSPRNEIWHEFPSGYFIRHFHLSFGCGAVIHFSTGAGEKAVMRFCKVVRSSATMRESRCSCLSKPARTDFSRKTSRSL